MLRIKEICKEKGISMQTLAEKRLGITNQALYASINGNPTLERLQQIATALEVDVMELFAPKESDVSGYIEHGGSVKKISSVSDLEDILAQLREK